MKSLCAAALLCCLLTPAALAAEPDLTEPTPAEQGLFDDSLPAEGTAMETAPAIEGGIDADVPACEESPAFDAAPEAESGLASDGQVANAGSGEALTLPSEPALAGEDLPFEKEARRSHPVEVQFEYIEHRFFDHRAIDNYSIHMYQEIRTNGTMSFWRGLTLTRPTGCITEENSPRESSDSWGIGPSFMIRWDKPVSEKWSMGIDGTGSLLVYNHAFPAGGRVFGFMWRIGPRLSYHPNEDSAIRLGWSFMHASNGFHSHNPGYNGVGFSLMYAHNF